jgi:hypothetical protein
MGPRTVGKRNKPFRQEIVDLEAIKATERYFKAAHRRKPRMEDSVFWTVPSYHGEKRRLLMYPSLYYRIVKMGEAVRAAGVIKREIDFTPHLMSRSIITNLSKAGMRVKALQNFSRHNNVQIPYYLAQFL